MSLPTVVFLDTSVLAGQQYNFTSTALATFLPVAKNIGLKLLLPDPTEREIIRQIHDRSQEALKALEDARRRAPFLAKWKHFPTRPTDSEYDWEVRNVALSEWREFLAQFEVIKLDYSNIDLKEIMRWYDSVTPPFGQGKKRKEFPDAFAVAIIEAYATKHDAFVAVVSEDLDFKLACDRYSSLLYFRSLPALTEVLLAAPSKIESLRASITKDLSLLEGRLFDEAQGLEFTHYKSNYKVRRSRIQSTSITDVRIVALGDGECTITFDADLEAEHLLEWHEWHHERDWGEDFEEWLLETSPISGTAKVSLDPATGELKTVMSIETDIWTVEVTENPRHYW